MKIITFSSRIQLVAIRESPIHRSNSARTGTRGVFISFIYIFFSSYSAGGAPFAGYLLARRPAIPIP